MIWIAVFIIAVIVEALTITFAALMIGIGAVAAFLLEIAGLSSTIQIMGFILVSIVLLLLVKPVMNKYFALKKIEKTNIDAIIGEKGYVTKQINNLKQTGEVKVNGLFYTARNAESDEVIDVDTLVQVVRVEGVKLLVKASNVDIDFQKGEY